MEDYQYEMIIDALIEKIRRVKGENDYLKWNNDRLEKKLAEIEKGVKQDGAAD